MSKIVKTCSLLCFTVFLFFIFSTEVSAIYDPLSVENNSFGIHVANISDLEDAARLVNSGEGDWGYVTLIITEDNRIIPVWQEVFDKMRRLHLIPIVRVATKEENGNWKKFSLNDIDAWVSFFNSLNWVIKNRYITIGNEVNLGKEWGGEVNPEEYASYLKEFTLKLKKENSDYFVMPAGFDASLPTTKSSLEESKYLLRMLNKEPDIFEIVDGWASHSYPNPNFSGSEYASGKGTIRTYDWEIAYLKSLGVKKNLPVFITETGWAHKVAGNKSTYKFLSENELFSKFEKAFSQAWNNKNIVAITPFILNYEHPPFDMFSWKNNGSFNSLYRNMQNIPKTKANPIQEDYANISKIFVPAINLLGNEFSGLFFVENKGQSIWVNDNLKITDEEGKYYEISKISLSSFEPGGSGFIVFKGFSPTTEGDHQKSLRLINNDEEISDPVFFKVVSIATLRMKIQNFLDYMVSLWHSGE